MRSTLLLTALRVGSLLPCGLLMVACDTTPVVATVDRPAPQRLLESCHRPDDRPDTGTDRQLATWEAETWQRGHDCADQVGAWQSWYAEGRKTSAP
jgi:hypothetical protein